MANGRSKAQSSTAIVSPNLGLWLNQPPIAVPDGALSAGHNFRIQNGRIGNLNLGWVPFFDLTLNGPVTLIDSFFDRDSSQILIFGTPTDLYRWDTVAEQAFFITPVENTGTVDVSTDDPAVVTVNTGTPNWQTNGIKAGDEIHFENDTEDDPTAVWYEIATVDSESQLTLTTAVAEAPLTNVTYTIRKRFTADLDTPWETATFLHEAQADEDLIFFTNGLDDILKWNGTGFVESAGFDFKAFHAGTYKNMLLFSAITDENGDFFPAQVRNSAPGDPLNFETGLASVLTAHEGSDEVNALLPLGDSLVAYSERHIIIMDFVGDPFIFVLRNAVPNLGPIAGRLVGDFGDTHTFMGPDAQYDFDGVTVQETGGQAFRDLVRRRNQELTLRSFSHFDEENGELIWAIPVTGDPDDEGPKKALVEHYLEEIATGGTAPISSRDFPFTASGFFERQEQLTWAEVEGTWEDSNFRWNDIFFAAAFPLNLVGDHLGNIFTLGTSQLGNGALLLSFVRTGRRATGTGRERNLLTRVYAFGTFLPSRLLDVTIRLFDSANGPVTSADLEQLPLDLGEGEHFTSHFRAGRFYELEFGSPGTAWEIAGWDIDLRPGGMR